MPWWPTNNAMVPRREISQEICFFPYSEESEVDENRRTFGLVVGPTGTGKTEIVRNLCNRYSHGVIYHDVREPKAFSSGLTKSVAMKISPSSVFDLTFLPTISCIISYPTVRN